MTAQLREGTAPTALLDWRSPRVAELVAELTPDAPRPMLWQAHALITERVRAAYAVDDSQPASATLRRGRGSCSQRLAVLESVARATGVATRVRGLAVDGSFWHDRFARLAFLVPDVVILAWPEFELEGDWVPVSALFGTVGSRSGDVPFTNADGETLFDALRRTAVDWDGETCSCSLAGSVRRDLGHFSSRDELFAAHGQTFSRPVRTLLDPVLSRWSPTA